MYLLFLIFRVAFAVAFNIRVKRATTKKYLEKRVKSKFNVYFIPANASVFT